MEGSLSLQLGSGHRNTLPEEGFLRIVLDIPCTEDTFNPDILGLEVSDLGNKNFGNNLMICCTIKSVSLILFNFLVLICALEFRQ